MPLRRQDVIDEAGQLLSRTGRIDPIIICTGPGATAGSAFVKPRNDVIFVILLDESYLQVLSRDAIRGIIAHEVAHNEVRQNECSRLAKAGKIAEYVQCEHDVDKKAACWVGRNAVEAGLRDAYAVSRSAGLTDITIEISVKERLRLLRNISEHYLSECGA
jgi:predicted SprT family Zn-dependent metalloprotease